MLRRERKRILYTATERLGVAVGSADTLQQHRVTSQPQVNATVIKRMRPDTSPIPETQV